MLACKHCITLLLSKNTGFQVGLYTNIHYNFTTSFNPVFAGCVTLDSSINLDVMQHDAESPGVTLFLTIQSSKMTAEAKCWQFKYFKLSFVNIHNELASYQLVHTMI